MTMVLLLIVVIIILLINTWLIVSRKASSKNIDLERLLFKIEADLARIEPMLRDEFRRSRAESQQSSRENREEQLKSFNMLGDNLSKTVYGFSQVQKSQFEIFSGQLKDFYELVRQRFEESINRQADIKKDTEAKLAEIRETVEGRLKMLQEDNNKKLEEMRSVVDEKLQETVERRFAESFKLISERLEQVHKGLGEMQTLASGVGDLKKVLTNVKTRGTLGEIQLGNILEQILSPEQYDHNAAVKEGSQERVEYVVKLPGKDRDGKSVLLPIDSKFPTEDYQRLLEAYDNIAETGQKEVEVALKQFENAIKKNARDIRDKYIAPPATTDFAIMFVPTEGLYAEVLRRTGLFETLQREFKVTVVGPANLVAFLSSLSMGFKTLAIEKRSSEVWEILGAVKTEFGNFGDVLEKTKKKLMEATNVIDKAGVRTRAIERRLRNVQELPSEKTVALLGDAIDIEAEEVPLAADGDDKDEA